ncbi:hypothetical protein ATANTOWER_027422, partial [Ataeniobius toweri]|nr:hypothetical protein [Ataeniobius toweri]
LLQLGAVKEEAGKGVLLCRVVQRGATERGKEELVSHGKGNICCHVSSGVHLFLLAVCVGRPNALRERG